PPRVSTWAFSGTPDGPDTEPVGRPSAGTASLHSASPSVGSTSQLASGASRSGPAEIAACRAGRGSTSWTGPRADHDRLQVFNQGLTTLRRQFRWHWPTC